MSAPGAKGDESLQLTPREITVWNAIKEDLEARRALVFLAKKMDMTESELIFHFVQEAFGPAVVLDVSWRKRVPDVKWLQRFAGTLRDLAVRVRKANALPLWNMTKPECGIPGITTRFFPVGKDTEAGVIVRDRYYRCLRDSFEHLPGLLDLYAGNLERKLNWTRGFARTRPTASEMNRRFTDLMEEFVRARCGQPYRDKVVAILRVTHKLANRKPPRVGDTLRKRSQRKRAHPSS
jgi:hypothetical protein